jgi:hypothetical protein
MINFYTVKGGQGATTIGACYALQLARSHQNTGKVTMVDVPTMDDLEDFCSCLGQRIPKEPGYSFTVAPESEIFVKTTKSQWHSWQTDVRIGRAYMPGHINVLVVRPCYLALRRAAAQERKPDLVILVNEPGRALMKYDVERALGTRCISMPWDPAVARGVDAGVFIPLQSITLMLEELTAEITRRQVRAVIQ